MKLDEDTLVEYLKIFAQTGISPSSPAARRNPSTVPPATEEEVLAAEAALGITLPLLLRRLYLEVSDGDFAYFLPLGEERRDKDYFPNSLAVWTLEEEKSLAVWTLEEPEKVLVVSDLGCNMYLYLDFAMPECPVLLDTEGKVTLAAPSLHEYLERWLDRGIK